VGAGSGKVTRPSAEGPQVGPSTPGDRGAECRQHNPDAGVRLHSRPVGRCPSSYRGRPLTAAGFPRGAGDACGGRIGESHARLVTAHTDAHRKAVCRRQDPQPRGTGVPSAVNTTRTPGTGCTLDPSGGVHLAALRDAQPVRASRGARVTLVGAGLGKVTRVWSRLTLMPTGKQSAAGRTLNLGVQGRRVPLREPGRWTQSASHTVSFPLPWLTRSRSGLPAGGGQPLW